jgi:hypothetical protein
MLLSVGFGYSAKQSVIAAYTFLIGTALAATLIDCRKRSLKGKRLLNYDLVMITLPMTASGSIFGVCTV